MINEKQYKWLSNTQYDYSVNVIVLIVILLEIIGVSWFYRVFWFGFSGLLVDEGFGYLGVSLVTVLILLFLSLRQAGFSFGFSLVRFLAGLLLVLLSLVFYFLGFVYGGFVVQFQGLSLVFLLLGLFVALFSPVYGRDVLPLLGLFLLVPLPAGFFDWLTPWLSRVIGQMVAWLTGSVFVGGQGFGVLYVDSPVGVVGFEVARACTGIVTLSSVLAVVPVVLYLLAFSPRGLKWRVLAGVLSLVVGVVIGFLGNVVRVLLVVLGTKLWGPDTGLGLFHYSPSVVYAGLAVYAGFWVARRVGGLDLMLPRLRVGFGPGSVRGVLGVVVLLLVLVGLFAGSVEAVGLLAGGSGGGEGVVVPSVGDFVGDPLGYLAVGDFRVVSSVRDDWLTGVLNALVVYRVVVDSHGGVFSGFVEVVDNPARLHTWQLCLQLQGYEVVDSYTRSVNGSLLNVIVLERDGRGYVLVYRLLPVELVVPGGGEYRLWVRVSLLSPGMGGEVVDRLSSVLLGIGATGSGNGLGVYVGAVRVLAVFVYILVLAIIVFAARSYKSRKRVGVAQGWSLTR